MNIFCHLLLAAALLVLGSRNPVHSVLFLILVFLNGAALLLLLGLDFLALLVLVVYVGAVAVLFLFIVMMLHLKLVRLGQSLFHHAPVALAVLAVLGLELASVVRFDGVVTDAGWIVLQQQSGTLPALGWLLYTHHWAPLLLASLVLLVALVGAIALTFDRSSEPTGLRQQVYLQVVRSNRPVLLLSMSFGFSGSVSPIMEGIIDLHNHIFFFLVLIFVFVFWLFNNILLRFWWAVNGTSPAALRERARLVHIRHLNHSTLLEIIWTVLPSLILVAVAVPSFALLYAMDEVLEPTLTLKAVGHQWYWSYQYSNCVARLSYVPADHPELVPQALWDRIWLNAAFFDKRILVDPDGPLPVQDRPLPLHLMLDDLWFRDWWTRKLLTGKVQEALSQPIDFGLRGGDTLPAVAFDSYMLSEEELAASGDYRLLEVDEPVVLPVNTHVRLLVTAEDVIHSFALPEVGVKLDAVPGRLNQQGLFLKRQGTFYGQCSELCGVNHGFMPVVVKGVSMREFVVWYLTKLQSQHPQLGLIFADPIEVQRWLSEGVPPPLSGLDRHPAADSLDLVTGPYTEFHSALLIQGFMEAGPFRILDFPWGSVDIHASPHYPPGSLSSLLEPQPPLRLFDWRSPTVYQSVSLAQPGGRLGQPSEE